jgi:hypothetical protein
MSLLILFEIFLLAVAFYGLYSFTGQSRLLIPLACLFCMFWVQRLENKQKEDVEANKRLLQYKLEKHHESMKKVEVRAKKY